jgi:cephalosporin-C deacetylase-like acetyl esterase
MRSWETAHKFVLEAFGIMEFEAFKFSAFRDAESEATSVVAVDYNGTDGAQLRGYLAMPEGKWERPLPAVVIIPDWDGVNAYEKERALALAELGYVAFAADIFGLDKQEDLEIPERIELTGIYRTNPELYISRIQSAIDQVKMLDSDVAMDEIAIVGYCFGGSVSIPRQEDLVGPTFRLCLIYSLLF